MKDYTGVEYHMLCRWLKKHGYSNTAHLSKKEIKALAIGIFELPEMSASESIMALFEYVYTSSSFKGCGLSIGSTRKRAKSKAAPKTKRVTFYDTDEWRAVRLDALIACGRKCCVCGRSAKDGVILHVDHIKPRSIYPELELDINNLQILCADCNLGKGNRYEEDWR